MFSSLFADFVSFLMFLSTVSCTFLYLMFILSLSVAFDRLVFTPGFWGCWLVEGEASAMLWFVAFL